MAYNRTNWVNDSLPAINAGNLNNMEEGIEEAHNNIGDLYLLNTENKDNLVNAINENIINYVEGEEITTNELYNGKRVYKKIYKGKMVNASSSSQSLFTIDVNFDNIWIDYGKSYINISAEQLSIDWFYTTSDYIRTWINFSQKAVRIKTGGDLSSFNYVIMISYTKGE